MSWTQLKEIKITRLFMIIFLFSLVFFFFFYLAWFPPSITRQKRLTGNRNGRFLAQKKQTNEWGILWYELRVVCLLGNLVINFSLNEQNKPLEMFSAGDRNLVDFTGEDNEMNATFWTTKGQPWVSAAKRQVHWYPKVSNNLILSRASS